METKNKPWQVVQLEQSKKLYESIGITKERLKVLDDFLITTIKNMIIHNTSISQSLESITKFAETPNESGYMTFKFGEGVEKFDNLNPMLLIKALNEIIG